LCDIVEFEVSLRNLEISSNALQSSSYTLEISQNASERLDLFKFQILSSLVHFRIRFT